MRMLPFFKPKKGFQFAGSGFDAGSGGGGGGGSNTTYEYVTSGGGFVGSQIPLQNNSTYLIIVSNSVNRDTIVVIGANTFGSSTFISQVGNNIVRWLEVYDDVNKGVRPIVNNYSDGVTFRYTIFKIN